MAHHKPIGQADEEPRQWRQLHTFKDPGGLIEQADYQPITIQKDPERILGAAFLKLGRDYGGPFEASHALRADRRPPPSDV